MTDTTSNPNGVYAAFAKALQDAKFVGKEGWNDQQKFKFRGIDGTLDTVGPAFRENNLFLIPEIVQHDLTAVQSARGKQMMQAVLTVRYTVAHADGSTISGTAVGEATDFADKATSKAASVALRTFLLQSMVLPTGDKDPDEEYNERGAARPPELPLYESPGWDPETASQPQLLTAMRQAQSVGNEEVASKIRAIGVRRFTPNTNQSKEQ